MRKLIAIIVVSISLVSCTPKNIKLSDTIKLYTDFQYPNKQISITKEFGTQEEFDILGEPTKNVVIFIQDENKEVTINEWTQGDRHVISDGEQIVVIK